MPPLREHREDIALLTGHFADRARRRLGTGPIRFAADALSALRAGAWPGNVRELENATSRAILRAVGRTAPGETVIVRASDLSTDLHSAAADPPRAPSAPPREGKSLRDALDQYQRTLVEQALRNANGNRASAARSLGMHRSNLHHLARRLGLR